MLLAQPRTLGHVFNPVSFWLAHDRDGALRAVISEVSNTFGDRHSYLCAHDDHRPITREDTLSAQKIFHVSPFQPIEGGYTFRFDIRDDRIGVWIDYGTGNEGLYATLTGKRAPLSTAAILRASLRRPFGARRVFALIHWQALKLWWKGAPYRATSRTARARGFLTCLRPVPRPASACRATRSSRQCCRRRGCRSTSMRRPTTPRPTGSG
jgi:DUF1365 family protein